LKVVFVSKTLKINQLIGSRKLHL